MLRHLLITALRNLARNRLQASIAILGLTIGFAAAMLTALFARNELSFDSFIPGADRAYVISSTLKGPGQADIVMDYAPPQSAAWLRLDFPEAKAVARLAYDRVNLRHGQVEASEDIAWVDPEFFDILPLPVVKGNPRRGLEAPEGVVITRTAARRYFGEADPIGRTLVVDRGRSLKVAAVIADLPAESHLTHQIFASSRSPYSIFSRQKAMTNNRPQPFMNFLGTDTPGVGSGFRYDPVRARVYVRLDGPADVERVAQGLSASLRRHAGELRMPDDTEPSLHLVPVRALHLYPFKGASLGATDARGSLAALTALGAIAALIVTLAVINFVNLTTARAGQRAVEVGVRKAAGARQSQLIAQFVGEAVLQTVLAMVLAIALTELLLPALNAFLSRQIDFPYWRDPRLMLLLAASTVLIGMAAGAYPAFVLAGLRPAIVLKGGPLGGIGSSLLRQGLVVFQFAVLVGLLLAVTVVWRQTIFAMNEGLGMDKTQTLVVYATPCRGAFADEVRRLPGVKGAVCSSRELLGLDDFSPLANDTYITMPGRETVMMGLGLVDFGFFELYGIKPVAGRLFDRAHPSDQLPELDPKRSRHGALVVNESGARRLGFARPGDAVGGRPELFKNDTYEIVGVVPDFTLDLQNAEIKPRAYLIDFESYPRDQVLSVKLDGRALVPTLAAIDATWRRTAQPGAIRREFLDDYVQRLYVSTLRQGFLVSVLCGVAVFLAVIGLLGLAAFTAERRTKEIGIRKAMGASTGDVLKLLLWGFTKPVLLANLIAWPLGWWLMNRWLTGFTYRIALTPDVFIFAAGTSLAIAWITVLSHALAVARAKPVRALRYE